MSVKMQSDFYKSMLYIKEIVSEGTISSVAQHNGIKAPNLSKLIKETESAFGKPLFIRTNRGLVPTDIALKIAKEIENIQKALDALLRFQISSAHQKPLKLYVSKGLFIGNLKDFKGEIEYTNDKRLADVLVTLSKPQNTAHMTTVENRLGQDITQSVWVCSSNNMQALALAEFITLRFHH